MIATMTTDLIQHLIDQGKAYVISTEVGNFVCAVSSKVPVRARPVHYPILTDFLRQGEDFPIWAPYSDGNPSPRGYGLFTVNFSLMTLPT